MEAISKRHILKKKRKRKAPSDGKEGATVRPDSFDGVTNWMKLQQVIEKTAKRRAPEKSTNSEEKSHFNRSSKNNPMNKKKQNKKIKKPYKIFDVKPQFKFDFKERKTVLISDETDLSDNNMEKEENDSECVRLTKAVAMDCEMVGTGSNGTDSMLARVSLVNAYGDCIYDEYVKPIDKVTDYRTEVSGIRPSDLEDGKDLFEVQKDVLRIIDGRRVVGHDLKHDFAVLLISHPRSLIRDTSKYAPFREVSGGRTPSLKKLAAVLLDCSIQSGEHSSVEDAQVAMFLYLKHKKEWERTMRRKKRK